ncbi:MAG: hypothetical protein PHS47_06420 [Methanocellales archaeon]|jgi:hypothetical protein|nr:hypothetical protein [Methanocellales archaeon]
MPANVVKTERDERLWAAAKEQAEAEGHRGNWSYVMGIFKRMKGKGKKPIRTPAKKRKAPKKSRKTR